MSSKGRKKPPASSASASASASDNNNNNNNNAAPHPNKSLTPSRSMVLTGERTVKRLRLSKALTVPQTTNIQEACRRMASRKIDSLLLTDSNALLCGILTDKDLAIRVVACEVNLEETPVSQVMTKNPTFVLSDTLAVEALQKMVQGKFRHLPVVENGEVIALLDIAKCFHDAIARMERAAEKGKAIAAAVEGVEKSWGTSLAGSNTFIETLRERIFKPCLSAIVPDNSKIVTISPEDTVLMAAKKMLEYQTSSAIVMVENKAQGILTPKDILMRVIANDLPPDSTPVEKVMTRNPQCATLDTPIANALHTMHDGKFLHLPVLDREGSIIAVLDVIHVTHAAVATVGSTSGNEASSSMLQKFWDSALAFSPTDDDEDNRSVASVKVPSDGEETGKSLSSPTPAPSFSFKIEDRKGRMHRFSCDTQNLTDLVASILQRVGDDIDRNELPQILYEDEDQDKVLLASDGDLATAVDHARSSGWKGLRLHLDYSGETSHTSDAWAAAFSAFAAGAALIAGLSVMAFLKRRY